MNLVELHNNALERLQNSPRMELAHHSLEELHQEVEILLAYCLNTSFSDLRIRLRTQGQQNIAEAQQKKFFLLLDKRCQKYPIAYITGEQPFWSLNLRVNENVLIPRPETECLVEFILGYFSDKPTINGLDLGTGSGAIILALAKEHPDWKLCASDISAPALECAKLNARENQLKVNFHQSNWFENLPDQQYDFIVSNPPYIEKDALELKSESIVFEPDIALSSGSDGLTAIREICSQSKAYLKNGAPLIIEHGFEQANHVKAIFLQNGFYDVECHQDYAQLDRYTVGFSNCENRNG